MQGDIGNLDQDIPHFPTVLHLTGFKTVKLLLQLLNNSRYTDIMNAGNRTIDGDRYLRSAILDGRPDIIYSGNTGYPFHYFTGEHADLVQFLTLHLDYDRDSFTARKGIKEIIFLFHCYFQPFNIFGHPDKLCHHLFGRNRTRRRKNHFHDSSVLTFEYIILRTTARSDMAVDRTQRVL